MRCAEKRSGLVCGHDELQRNDESLVVAPLLGGAGPRLRVRNRNRQVQDALAVFCCLARI